jgi:tripartite-type tricarboxylate transporter receptor subunit TctC
MQTRRTVLICIVGLTTLGLVGPIQSQSWPEKPVKIIVPFAAGGNTDGIARTIAQRLGETFGQQFVVENRTGAGGTIAAEVVARSPADGYTLLMAALPIIAIVPAMSKTRYDPMNDFAPISNVATNPFVLAVHKDVPVKTLAEFVAYVRAQPQKLSYASAGIGSLNHLSMALFLKLADLEMIHVTYKGNAPALSDVVAGHVPAIFTNLSDALPQAAGGTIRLLAISSEQRVPQLSDVPTVSESGYPTFKTLTWNGLMAPAGTPKPIIDRIATEVRRAVKDPKLVERFASYGVDAVGSSSEQFAATIAADITLWAEAVKIAGVKEP